MTTLEKVAAITGITGVISGIAITIGKIINSVVVKWRNKGVSESKEFQKLLETVAAQKELIEKMKLKIILRDQRDVEAAKRLDRIEQSYEDIMRDVLEYLKIRK